MKQKPFTFKLLIMGGLVAFVYVFSALATSIYRDYRLERQIRDFQQKINELDSKAKEKPDTVKFFASAQYRDRYAKENLNLLNPGERLIVIPQEDINRQKGPQTIAVENVASEKVLKSPHPRQWWDYFFGPTLTAAPQTPLLPEPVRKPTEDNEKPAPSA